MVIRTTIDNNTLMKIGWITAAIVCLIVWGVMIMFWGHPYAIFLLLVGILDAIAIVAIFNTYKIKR